MRRSPDERHRLRRLGRLVGLAVAAAAVIVSFLVGSRGVFDSGAQSASTDAGSGPQQLSLSASPLGVRDRADLASSRETDAATAIDAKPATPNSVLRGTVVDEATGVPIPGAVVFVYTAQFPEPPPDRFYRLACAAESGWDLPSPDRGRELCARSGANGDFALPWPPAPSPKADVYARAPGYVVTAAFARDPETPVTIRLRAGASIEGTVVDPAGAPIPGAAVECEAVSDDPQALGHRDVAKSGGRGEFRLQGLLPGTVRVRTHRAGYASATSAPIDPGATDVRITMVPEVLFAIDPRTEDGTLPPFVLVRWSGEGGDENAPHWELLNRARSADGELPKAPWEPIAVPANAGTIRVELASAGFKPWRSAPIEVPREGGATTVSVRLEHDPECGRLVVHLQKDGVGTYGGGSGVQIYPNRMDGKQFNCCFCEWIKGSAHFAALPAGRYDLWIRARYLAPIRAEATVEPGRTTEMRAVGHAAASVRVRLTGAEEYPVRLRLIRDGHAVPLWIGEFVWDDGMDCEGGAEAKLYSGGKGTLLTGLGSGRHLIEVVSPDLVAKPTPVDLVEGETREVEIPVARR